MSGQRVMLWNPWQAGGPDFWSHGKPVEVPAGWRVLGHIDKDLILISDREPVDSAVQPNDAVIPGITGTSIRANADGTFDRLYEDGRVEHYERVSVAPPLLRLGHTG